MNEDYERAPWPECQESNLTQKVTRAISVGLTDGFYIFGEFMNDWIIVRDKLPEPGTTVLAYTDANRIVIRKFCKHKFSEMADKITHWMQLPDKPDDV